MSSEYRYGAIWLAIKGEQQNFDFRGQLRGILAGLEGLLKEPEEFFARIDVAASAVLARADAKQHFMEATVDPVLASMVVPTAPTRHNDLFQLGVRVYMSKSRFNTASTVKFFKISIDLQMHGPASVGPRIAKCAEAHSA